MALAKFNLVVTDESGNVVDGASISVQNEDSLAFPQLFSDRAGITSIGNPFTATDGANAGFHVVGGPYKIVATLGAFSRTWRYVGIGRGSENDAAIEEGLWTPSFAVFTPGNLSVVYGTQEGRYLKIGNEVIADFRLSTSTWTWTTASGQVTIEGLPFAADNDYVGTFVFSGITKASYTQFAPVTATGFTNMAIECSGSGVAISNIQVSNMPSGTQQLVRGTITYHV